MFGLLPNKKGDFEFEYCKDGKVKKIDEKFSCIDLVDYSIKTNICSNVCNKIGLDNNVITYYLVGEFRKLEIWPNYFIKETFFYNNKTATYFKSLCERVILFKSFNTLAIIHSNIFLKNKLLLLGQELELHERFWVGINDSHELIENSSGLRTKIVAYLGLTIIDDDFDRYKFRVRAARLDPYNNEDFSYKEFVLMFWSVAFRYVKGKYNIEYVMKSSNHYDLWFPDLIYKGFRINLVQVVKANLDQLGGEKILVYSTLYMMCFTILKIMEQVGMQ